MNCVSNAENHIIYTNIHTMGTEIYDKIEHPDLSVTPIVSPMKHPKTTS